MKNVLLVFMMSISASAAFANLVAVGAANVSTCAADLGTTEAFDQAKTQAKIAADENCRMNGNKNPFEIQTEVLFQRGGSCWANANSSVVVLYTYECKN